jgi:hypothetical protein
VSTALPDPLEFAADALLARGAVVEREGQDWVALLPGELAREFLVEEECRLVTRSPETPRADLLACGLGTPAFERLASQLERAPVLASARFEVDPPRTNQVRALLERFDVRNAPSVLGEIRPVSATYLVVWFSWSAEADDRYDGMVQAGVCLDDAAAADPAMMSLADPVGAADRLLPVPLATEPDALRRGLRLASARAEPALDAPLANVRALVARRLRRDHERIAEYFEQLARDASRRRRRIDPAAVEQRLAHLHAERDAKLRALGERYRIRVTLVPVAFVLLEVPALGVQLRVRRRKLEGEIRLRLASGASAFDRLACAACSGATSRPLVCDDRLHVLCEVCAPSSQGRPLCPACGGRRSG